MKLHIGCGGKFLQGWKHVDIMRWEHIDYVTNVRDLSFLENDSVEEIYACHVFEHFKRSEIEDVLAEWSRVLYSGGRLRLAVPDFAAIVAEYLQNWNLSAVLGLLYGGQNYAYNFHYHIYDFDSMRELLGKAGFVDIHEYDWREFLPADGYDDYSRAYLPHMDFENGRLMSLNVLATKA